MKKRFTLVLAGFLLTGLFVYGQETPIKAGKISKKELQMQRCEIDTNAQGNGNLR